MSVEVRPGGCPEPVGGILRRPGGSIDIPAYAAIAHRQRAAAMASSMLLAVQFLREMWSVIGARATFSEKSVAAKDCAHIRR
jgi:hypothetical protein